MKQTVILILAVIPCSLTAAGMAQGPTDPPLPPPGQPLQPYRQQLQTKERIQKELRPLTAQPSQPHQVQQQQQLQRELRQQAPHIMTVRGHVASFFAAKQRGDRNAAARAAENANKVWQNISTSVRSHIDARYPGTSTRLTKLTDEFDLPEDDSLKMDKAETATQPAGEPASRPKTPGSESRPAKSTSAPATRSTSTPHKALVVMAEGTTWAREGDSVIREGGTTRPADEAPTGRSGVKEEDKTPGREIVIKATKATTREASTRPSAGKTWKPKYRDLEDVFGGRPLPTKLAKAEAATRPAAAAAPR